MTSSPELPSNNLSKMRFNGSGMNGGEVRLIPSISVQGPDDNGSSMSDITEWTIDNTERQLNDIFSGLFRKRSSSIRSDSSMDASSMETTSAKFSYEMKSFVPAPTNYGLTGSRVMTLEEELQERLKFVNEVASLWQRRCKQERDENMRMRDQIISCEKHCRDLIGNVREHFERTIEDLNSNVKKYRTQYDKLLKTKSSQEKDHSAQVKLLQFHKSKLEKHTEELESGLGEIAERALVYKKEIQFLKDDLKAKNQRITDFKSLSHSIELMEKKITELEGRVKELNHDLDRQVQINQTLKSQNSVYKSEHDRIVQEMVAERTLAEHDRKSLHDALNVLKDRSEEEMTKNRKLETEYNTAKEDYDELFVKYQKLHVKQMDTGGDSGQCNPSNILLDIALTRVAQLEELHFSCSQSPPRKISDGVSGDFQISIDEKDPTLIQVIQTLEPHKRDAVSGDLVSMASDGASGGSDLSGGLEDSFGSDARLMPVTSRKDTTGDRDCELHSSRSFEVKTSRSLTFDCGVKTASCGDLRKESRSLSDTTRRLTPPPILSSPGIAGQARNSIQVTHDRECLSRLTSIEKQQRSMILPMLAATKFLRHRYKQTPPSQHPVSVHITTPSPQNSAQSSPTSSPQHREIQIRPRPHSAPARSFFKTRSLSESEAETILEECENPDDTLLVRSLTIDNDFLKSDRYRLRKRSSSERDLNAICYLDLLPTSSSGDASPRLSDGRASPADQSQSSKISGFEGLRNRRNGIIGTPLPINKNIKVAKKSKAGDFFRKISKEVKENSAFEAKSNRKRSWKIKSPK